MCTCVKNYLSFWQERFLADKAAKKTDIFFEQVHSSVDITPMCNFSTYIKICFYVIYLRFFTRHFKCKFNYTHMLRDAFQDGYCINVIFIIAFLCICNFYGFSIYIMCFYICTKAFSHDI